MPCVAPPEASTASTGEVVPARPATKRILIIEDDADGREALRMQLVMAGHDVHVAANGSEGIETAARIKQIATKWRVGRPVAIKMIKAAKPPDKK